MATLRSRAIKEIYSDENSSNSAGKQLLHHHPVSDSSSSIVSSSGSRKSVCGNYSSVVQGEVRNQQHHPASLIRSDSRVSIVSDGNSYRERSNKSGCCELADAEMTAQEAGGDGDCDGGSGSDQQNGVVCQSKRGSSTKLPATKPAGELRLEFIQVGRGASKSRRGSKARNCASFSAAKNAKSKEKEDLQQQATSRNLSGQKKKRSARVGVSEDNCGEFRLKRDKKYLILTCDSPTVSEQSAVSKVGSPVRNQQELHPQELECGDKGACGDGSSDSETLHSGGGMGELSPVSVLCPTLSNQSSLEPVSWGDLRVDGCTASTVNAAAPQLADGGVSDNHPFELETTTLHSLDGRQEDVIFPEPAEAQFLLKDPAACQNVQESQIRSLMTSMLHEISGEEEEMHHVLQLGDDDMNGPVELVASDDPAGSNVQRREREELNFFREDLHMEDFEVQFLELLQSDGTDCSSSPPGSSTGYFSPQDFRAEFQEGGVLLQPPNGVLGTSPELQSRSDFISLDEADGGHAKCRPAAPTIVTAECHGQQKVLPPAAATAFQHQWAPPWGATPDGTSSESEYNGIRLVHLLLAGAEAMAMSNIDLVSVILVRLKELSSRSGSTMQRVAAYFCEGLQCRVDQLGVSAKGGSSSALVEVGKCDPIADTLGAFQILHEISPYIKFAHFTANQAILEAFENEKRVHIIDYDIMEGMQWPSLMQALASRPEGPPHLRITALCRGSSGSKRTPGSLISTVQETGRRLSEFAASLHIPFSFHQAKVDVENSQEFRPAVLKLVKGEAIAVNCMLHLPHMGTGGSAFQSSRITLGAVHAFFSAMNKLSPAVMTVVEEELSCCFPSQGGAGNSVNFFFEALHHYSAIFDSLEASLAPESTVRHMVERIFLAPRIANLVANFSAMGHTDAAMEEFFSESENHEGSFSPQRCSQALPSGLSEGGFETLSSSQIYNFSTEDVMRKNEEGSMRTPSTSKHWSSLAFASGFVPTQTSYKSQWQAKLLLSLFRDGYRLEQRGHRLVLGWRSFPLISASAWRCQQ